MDGRLVVRCRETGGLSGGRSQSGNAQWVANGSGGRFLELTMPRDRATPPAGGLSAKGAVGAFTVKTATGTLEIPNQIAPFHPAGISTEMVSHIAPPGASLRALCR